jgi:hypothetical protein
MKPVVPPFQRGGGFGTLGSSFEQPALPAAASWQPATWGAWLSIVLFAAALGFAGWRLFRSYRRRAPRRAGLRELASLQGSTDPRALSRFLVVLKTVALSSYGRERVAALSGERWRAFLVETSPAAGFDQAAGEALVRLAERGPDSVTLEARAALWVAGRSWIRDHRPIREVPRD